MAKSQEVDLSIVFSSEPAGERSEGPRALIIDDSMLFRRSMARLLESEGLRVAGNAPGGVLGAELAISLRPDLIMVDHNMPDMNGVQTLKVIRDAGVKSRVIVCTSEITLESSQDYALLGADAIFIKPIPLHAFRRVLRNAFRLEAEASEKHNDGYSSAGGG
ncbi:response regulator [bacterium]|nr:response regulator [bacterium]